jgi:hypothetical protein
MTNVYSSNNEINVVSSQPSYVTTSENLPSSEQAGAVRFDSSDQTLKVYNGGMWVEVPDQEFGISLDVEVINAIEWAKDKQKEEGDLKAKIERFPTLKDAYEKYKIIEALVSNYEDAE